MPLPDSAQLLQQDRALNKTPPDRPALKNNRKETPLRHQEADAQRLRQRRDGLQQLAARMIDIGHKLIETSAFIVQGKWLTWVRTHH